MKQGLEPVASIAEASNVMPIIEVYNDKLCHIHINMCINIRLPYKMIAYSCFVLFLAYKNCKFKAGGGNDVCMLYLSYCNTSVTSRHVASSAAGQHVFW